MNSISLALLFSLVLGTFAHAAEDQKVMDYVLCKHEKTVRTIRITPEKAAPNDCQVTYSKSGVDAVVGQSRSLSSCRSILKNIQENLESSKWNCKQIDSAKISYSNEVTVE